MAKARGGKKSGESNKQTASVEGAGRPATALLVLDSSDAGGPVIGGRGPSGVAEGFPSPSGDKLAIDIQLAPGAVSLRAPLTGNTAAFLSAAEGGSVALETGLSAVLRRFGLIEAKAHHDERHIQEEEQRMSALRQAEAIGAASSEQVAAHEQLPPMSSLLRLWFPSGTSATAVTEELEKLPEVAKAAWVPGAAPPMALAAPLPNDPLIGSPAIATDPATQLETQWYLHRTRVLQAWRYSRGANVVIADIDWGYRTSHQEFAGGAIERRYNAVSGGDDVTHGASAAHGTAVLGIAGARSNGAGISGYAPDAALWAIQADSATSPAAFQEPWAEAIDFVRRTDSGGRRKVIILEVQTWPALGNYEQVLPVHRAIRAAIADNCVVCVAAGNGNRPADRSDLGKPFDPTGSILVGATAFHDAQNKRAFFSNYGSRVVVSAPGDPDHDLTCAQSGDTAYRNGFGGTSGATPKVAGVVALMLSVNPDLTHADVREILIGTGSALTEDPGKPIGVFLNAEAAVAEALRRRTETTPGVALPGGQVSPEVTAAKPLHGVRRRSSQLVLPDETGSPISWDAALEAVPMVHTVGLQSSAAPPAPGEPPANDKTLQFFRRSVEGTLTQQDRIQIVEQAIQMLDNFYVHRPLKEAIHAVRPIQRLRVLLRRLQQSAQIPTDEKDELTFHNTLTEIFNSVRDLHTNYQLPRPYRNYIAYLPFEVGHFYEDEKRRYLVTRVVPGYQFNDSEFEPGAELLYWNGMTIERAVRRNSDQTAGSNEAARHARGVSSLTLRPMHTALPPDADFVDIEFVPAGADADDPKKLRRMRQLWFCRYTPEKSAAAEAPSATPGATSAAGAGNTPPPESPAASAVYSSLDLSQHSPARSSEILFEKTVSDAPFVAPAASESTAPPMSAKARSLGLAAVLGLDTAADAVREARELIFGPASFGDLPAGTEIAVQDTWKAAFRARILDIAEKSYGHIHIRTFYVEDADGFVREFERLVTELPENGLILDVRGNGGGNIWAAERLLQTMCPVEIVPERMQFVVTPGTRDLCRNHPATSPIPLHFWLPSIDEAVETGSVYSHAFPVTDQESCNTIGQRYYGPVVLLVDGNCYSATDMFAAGFQDHDIGQVIGVSSNTGAGGANVWEHWLLTEALPAGWGLKPLPNQAGMRVAIRQCLRVGPKSGALLEDFGVVPHAVYKLRREDLMEGDRGLLAFAAASLVRNRVRGIKVAPGAPHPTEPEKRQLKIRTSGLDRLDFFLDGRPQASINLSTDAAGEATLTPSVNTGVDIKLVGYHREKDLGYRPAALYRGRV